jgi:glycosyltransferase 2 family protein
MIFNKVSSNTKKFLVLFLITICIFLLLFSRINFFSIIQILLSINLFILFLALFVTFILTLIMSRRWQILLHSSNIDISFRESFEIFMGTYPFAAVMPSMSSDLIRAIPLKERYRISKVIGSCLSEKTFDFIILLFILWIGMSLTNNWNYLNIIIISFFLIAVFSIVIWIRFKLPVSEKWNERLLNILDSLRFTVRDKVSVFSVIIFTLSVWILSIFQVVLFFYAVNVTVPITVICAFIPLAIFIGMIPVSLGGAGTRDAAIILLFAQYGTTSQLLAVGILFSFFRCWLPAIIGLPFMEKIGITKVMEKPDLG